MLSLDIQQTFHSTKVEPDRERSHAGRRTEKVTLRKKQGLGSIIEQESSLGEAALAIETHSFVQCWLELGLLSRATNRVLVAQSTEGLVWPPLGHGQGQVKCPLMQGDFLTAGTTGWYELGAQLWVEIWCELQLLPCFLCTFCLTSCPNRRDIQDVPHRLCRIKEVSKLPVSAKEMTAVAVLVPNT